MNSNLAAPMHIVFLDGHCLLCQRAARLLARLDRSRHLHFAPLQGETAACRLEEKDIKNLHLIDGSTRGSMVLLETSPDGTLRIWKKSDATLRALYLVGGLAKAVWMLRFVPRTLRDWLYDTIARNRIRWFGSSETCQLPDSDFRGRILP